METKPHIDTGHAPKWIGPAHG